MIDLYLKPDRQKIRANSPNNCKKEDKGLPNVSFIIPVGSVDDYTRAAIASAMFDQYTDKEIIVIDNTNNTDEVQHMLSTIQPSQPLRYIRCSEKGVAQALRAGVAAADSNYIARLDADDINHPDRITTQLQFLESNHGASAVGAYANRIDHAGRKIGNLTTCEIASLKELLATLNIENPFIHPTMLIRRSVFDKLNYENWAVNCQDWDLWARMCQHGMLIQNVPAYLIDYRMHNEQQSRMASQIAIDSLKRLFHETLTRPSDLYIYQRSFCEPKRINHSELQKILSYDKCHILNQYTLRKFLSSVVRSLMKRQNR